MCDARRRRGFSNLNRIQMGAKRQQPRVAPRKRKSFWRLLGPLLAAIICFWIGREVWQRRQAPSLPAIDLTNAPSALRPVLADALEKIRRTPRSAAGWGELGMIRHGQDQLAAAEEFYREAQRLDPKDPRWPYYRGVLALPKTSALPLLERTVALAPAEPAPRLRLAGLLFDHGRLDDAAAHYRTLLNQEPEHPAALLGLARVYAARSQWQEASDTLRRILEKPRVARPAYLLMASVQQHLGKIEASRAAAEIARQLPEEMPEPDPLLAQLGKFKVGEQILADEAKRLLDVNQTDAAAAVIERALREYPTSTDAWLLLGRLRLRTNDCAGAAAALRKHLELAPNSVNGYAQLGIAYLCQQRYEPAVDALEKALAIKPDFGQTHFNHGYALAKLGRAQPAMEAFRRAIRCNPGDVEPYIVLADLLAQSGEPGEARRILQQAAVVAPGDPRIEALAKRMTVRE